MKWQSFSGQYIYSETLFRSYKKLNISRAGCMIQHSVGKSDDSEKYQDKCVELFYYNVEKDDLKVVK